MFQVQIAGCPGEVKASSSWYFWCWSNQRIKLHQQRFRLDTGRNFSTEKVIKRLDRAARGSGGVTVEMFKERLAVVWCVRWCSVPAGALTPELSYGRTAPWLRVRRAPSAPLPPRTSQCAALPLAACGRAARPIRRCLVGAAAPEAVAVETAGVRLPGERREPEGPAPGTPGSAPGSPRERRRRAGGGPAR